MKRKGNLLHGSFRTGIEEELQDNGSIAIKTKNLYFEDEMKQVCEFIARKDTNPFTNRSIAIGSKTFWKVVRLCESKSSVYQTQVKQTLNDLESQLAKLKDITPEEISKRKTAYSKLFQPDVLDSKTLAKERKKKYVNVFSHLGEEINRIDGGLDGFIPLLPADELVIRSKIQETLARLRVHIDLIDPFFDDLCRSLFTGKKYGLDLKTFKVDRDDWQNKTLETVKTKPEHKSKPRKEVHSQWRPEEKLYYFALRTLELWDSKFRQQFTDYQYPPPTSSERSVFTARPKNQPKGELVFQDQTKQKSGQIVQNEILRDFKLKILDFKNQLGDKQLSQLKLILPDESFMMIPKVQVSKLMLDFLEKDFEAFSTRYVKSFGKSSSIDGAQVCKWKATKSNKGMLKILLADDPALLTLLLQYNQMLDIIKNISMIAKGKGNEKRLSQVFDNIALELKSFATFFDALFKRLINDTKYLDVKNRWPSVLPTKSKQIISDSLSPDRAVIAYQTPEDPQ
jgi:hypothetical protein